MTTDTSAEGVAPDPGMAVKMGAASFAGIADLAAGRATDEQPILELCDFVDARLDCADFRMMTILKVLHAWPDLVSEPTRERMRRTVLGFKYWMDEPGDDGMCHWSENHQVIYATCEVLAGQLFPHEVFTGGWTGEQRMARGAERLLRWFGHRFDYGFSEWLSNTYYEEDVAPLALLVDHCDDGLLVDGAAMALDLLLLDIASHLFDGRLVASAGRAYEEQKKDPARADVNDVIRRAFGPPATLEEFDLERTSMAFVTCEGYRVPDVIREIAAAPGPATVRSSHGLDDFEVVGRVGAADDVEVTGAYFWGMEAFTSPHAIETTARAIRHWRMARNTFLKPLGWARFVAGAGLLAPLVRVLNPAAQGVTINRADVVTTRTPHWQLSAAQRYRPREFGDQQHLWTAALPGDITVFALHPGAPMFDETARGFSPAQWVGNGINPDVVADGNLLVAAHDLTVRGGVLERDRQQYSHLWFPADRFDETVRGDRVVVGRRGDSLVGVVAAARLTDGTEPGEIVQHGRLTGWGVVCSDTGESGSAAELARALGRTRLVVGRDLTTWHLGDLPAAGGRRVVGLPRDGAAHVDGREVVVDHPRLDAPWAYIERFPEVIEVAYAGHRLRLERAGFRRTT
ncbi:hypothetical protein GCM10027418_30340 [Mariniluteicoccus endophyticus]